MASSHPSRTSLCYSCHSRSRFRERFGHKSYHLLPHLPVGQGTSSTWGQAVWRSHRGTHSRRPCPQTVLRRSSDISSSSPSLPCPCNRPRPLVRRRPPLYPNLSSTSRSFSVAGFFHGQRLVRRGPRRVATTTLQNECRPTGSDYPPRSNHPFRQDDAAITLDECDVDGIAHAEGVDGRAPPKHDLPFPRIAKKALRLSKERVQNFEAPEVEVSCPNAYELQSNHHPRSKTVDGNCSLVL